MFSQYIQWIMIVNHEIMNWHQVHDKENKIMIEVHKKKVKGMLHVPFKWRFQHYGNCYKPF